ncbi:Por secretion system C-terminal sorting domain-containing protein [Tenacibaculum sp. MAR_2009_124]|uniref:T9SS type A sorting domain-containing protein n=1 Tax=Tenacibaculum sp. MAR_2009_124 TaxID=1250059 RepID=UPI000894AF8A|nr:T9SS type A sorting domain-containing protein [Tenacibaculum sp. MAR_2009_124]SED15423.1 Por secretion system C-terminal sorting domain-containing protein [Tenacibaculum sp. MAR_2009_124]
MKKKLLLISTFLICSIGYAQITIEKSTEKSLDQMLKKVDKTSLKSGVLLNRSMNFSKIHLFNSDENDKPANFAYMRQALLDLYNASKGEKFISYLNLKEKLKKSEETENVVSLGLVNTDFETLNYSENSNKESGVKLNGDSFTQLVGKKPFISHHSLLISPMKDAVKGNVIKFKLSKEYWYENSDKKIQNLSIRFNEENFITLVEAGKIVRNTISYSFKETGVKTLKFKTTFKDGSIKETKGSLYVITDDILRRPPTSSSGCSLGGAIENGTVTADIPFRGYDESSPLYGKIDYRIFFRTSGGNTSSTLRKPVIIIDGFDPQDRRRIQDADCAADPACASRYISGGQFSAEEHRSIKDMMSYQDTSGAQQNLICVLRSLGYDVVIVNHATYTSGGRTIDGGADYIERNGLNLTRLIRNLNTRLSNNSSNEGLVIVGPSMGGQISRYALAYMEKKYAQTNQSQWNHNTRLWVSVDSPHLGANIPLGLQALINQVKGDSSAAQDFADNQLGSAGAKQQLIEQYNGTSGSYLNARTVSQGYSYSRGAPFFKNFYNSLFNNGLPGSKGYPQNLRKISLVNGSLKGSRAYENPFTGNANDAFANHSQQAVNLRAFQRIITATVHIGSIETYFLPNTSGYGKISRFKKGFNDTSIYTTNNNSRGNMDNVPGGWFPGQYELAAPVVGTSPVGVNGSFWTSFEDAFDNIVSGLLNLLGGNYWSLRTLKHSHSFIASFSAIGHLSPDRSWAGRLDKNLVCQNLTPFDSYFGHDKNTQHTSFNKESVPWLLAELAGNAQLPYFPVNVSNLVGTSTICRNETKTYTFTSCSTPGNVQQWTSSSNLPIISSTGNSVTIRPPADNRTTGWIKARFTNGVTVQKNIWVGRPGSPASLSGPTSVNTGALVRYNGGISQGATSYVWWLPYPFDVSSPIDYFAQNWQMAPTNHRNLTAMTGYARNSGLVQLMGNNRCGRGGAKYLRVSHASSGGGGGGSGGGGIPRVGPQGPKDAPVLRVYPNPATESIFVNLPKVQQDEVFEVVVSDLSGRVIYQRETIDERVTLDVSKFSRGYYIVSVGSEHQQLNKKISVK